MPFPTLSTAPLEHRKEKKKILWKINHMLVLKLCQQSSQLGDLFQTNTDGGLGVGDGRRVHPILRSQNWVFFFFIQEGRVGKQTDSSEKDATNTQSDFYIWVENEKVLHRSVNLT